ncbi:DUF4190 domain-containing protein [Streptomyces cremeus]|uniref:DUF4190 domain-containing protein n=1 Tax=Streptomyces cremeus TaxID=66881 RepID=A0ABV5PCK3_STRCM
MSQPPSPFEPNPWAPPQEGAADQRTRIGDPPPAPYAPGPGYGYGPQTPYPFGYGQQPESPQNGMGITAVVLGLAGCGLGVLVFLFWMSWLPSLLAVVFGFVGLAKVRKGAATNKGLTLAGTILGFVGILMAVGGGFLTLKLYRTGIEERDRQVRVSESRAAELDEELEELDELGDLGSDEPPLSPSPTPEARILGLGETFRYDNGVKVTIGKPTAFTPNQYSIGQLKSGHRAYYFKVTIANDGPKKVALLGYPQVTDAEGSEADIIYDGDHSSHLARTVLPGKQTSALFTYQVPKSAAKEWQIEFQPAIEGFEPQIWAGRIK